MTTFADLGLDPDTVFDDLEALGIDTSPYVDNMDLLKSLSLACNLIVLYGISTKSDEIEFDLNDYQITVDITSGMQETLNDFRDNVSPSDADTNDIATFLASTETYMDVTDASTVEVDYTYGDNTYSTLQDVLDALDDGSLLTAFFYAGGYDSSTMTIYDDSGVAQTPGSTAYDNFISNGYYLENHFIDGVGSEDHYYYLQADELKSYFIVDALVNAGLITSNVADLNGDGNTIAEFLLPFAQTDAPSWASDPDDSDGFVKAYQYYYGAMPIEFDASEGTVTVWMNSMAGMAQMGIDLGEYFKDASYPAEKTSLFEDEQNKLAKIAYCYAYQNNEWDNIKGNDATDKITSDDIDSAMEAMATAIEAQSNDTEIALLEVNSSITEWGELNDVWDMIHQYIHDALKRAEDNQL